MRGSCRVLVVPGSLRRRSTNVAVLRTAMATAPDGVVTTLYDDLAALPAFNPDLDVAPLPAAVDALRRSIRAADALLFSVPEYAGGLPGAFKNLLDWSIGDDQAGSLSEKPVAWINASTRGAALAHESLRTVLGYAGAVVVDAACLHVPVREAMVDPKGLIADPSVAGQTAEALAVLAAYVAARTDGPGPVHA